MSVRSGFRDTLTKLVNLSNTEIRLWALCKSQVNWNHSGSDNLTRHHSCPMQPDILNPPLLRLTSRKPLWLDLQPIDIKSRWRHNWSRLRWSTLIYILNVRPHNPATGFWPSSATWSLLQCGLYWTVLARISDTTLPVEGNGDLQILICFQLRPDPNGVTHCQILSSDKAEWRLIPATLCRWRRCFLADQLWFMTRIREEEEVTADH